MYQFVALYGRMTEAIKSRNSPRAAVIENRLHLESWIDFGRRAGKKTTTTTNKEPEQCIIK